MKHMTFEEIKRALINLRLEFYAKLGREDLSARDTVNIDAAIDAINKAIVAVAQVGDSE